MSCIVNSGAKRIKVALSKRRSHKNDAAQTESGVMQQWRSARSTCKGLFKLWELFKKYTENRKMSNLSITKKCYLKSYFKVALSWVQIFLQDFTCIAIIYFELLQVNKTPPLIWVEKNNRDRYYKSVRKHLHLRLLQILKIKYCFQIWI